MGEFTVRWEGGEWIDRGQAVRLSGLSASIFDRLAKAGVIEHDGATRDRTYRASTVWAAAHLWRGLRELLDPKGRQQVAPQEEDGPDEP